MRVAFIDSMSFTRILGPLRDILKRNADKYASHLNK